MEQPQTLIEAFRFEDRDILLGRRASDAFRYLEEIVRRLPEPRAYACETVWQSVDTPGLVWEIGKDILTSLLVRHGRSVIDPESLEVILSCNAHLANKMSSRNPVLLELMQSGCLQEIYLPDEEHGKAHKGLITAVAKKRGIAIHFWEPEVISPTPPHR